MSLLHYLFNISTYNYKSKSVYKSIYGYKTYNSEKSLSLSKYRRRWASACWLEYDGRSPPGPWQLRGCRTRGGSCREELRLVSRTALATPDVRSKTPATGLVTVPITPFPTPLKKPCNTKSHYSKIHTAEAFQHMILLPTYLNFNFIIKSPST